MEEDEFASKKINSILGYLEKFTFGPPLKNGYRACFERVKFPCLNLNLKQTAPRLVAIQVVIT